MDDRLAIAFYPFDRGLIDLPGSGTRGLVLNAVPGMRRPDGFQADLSLVQDLRPLFLPLKNAGHEIASVPDGADYDLAIVLAGRHRRQNEFWIAESLARTRPGGLVVVAGSKTDGIASLKKRVDALLPLAGSQSKYHGMVFWLASPADPRSAITALTPSPGSVEGNFVTGPGMFSANEADPGSRLLADSVPADVKGAAADFGAGWGYLSARLAEHEAIRSIDLFEASHAALEAARTNLRQHARPSLALGFFWQDLLSEPVAGRYDVIVMNPPFHQGRAAQPDIGVTMIGAALGSLKRGGRLFMVANKGLPYDEVLQAGSLRHGELARDQHYRVLWAMK
ncbi:MAG: class I SAM-dependent methyltransferase [Rhizobiaceae bacterium]